MYAPIAITLLTKCSAVSDNTANNCVRAYSGRSHAFARCNGQLVEHDA